PTGAPAPWRSGSPSPCTGAGPPAPLSSSPTAGSWSSPATTTGRCSPPSIPTPSRCTATVPRAPLATSGPGPRTPWRSSAIGSASAWPARCRWWPRSPRGRPASSAWPTAAPSGPPSRPPRSPSTPPDHDRRPAMPATTSPPPGPGPLDRVELRPIGYVRTSYRSMADTPIQTARNPDERGRLVLHDQYAPGLDGLEGFDYAHLICFLDRAWQADSQGTRSFTGDRLRPVPFLLHETRQRARVFATP